MSESADMDLEREWQQKTEEKFLVIAEEKVERDCLLNVGWAKRRMSSSLVKRGFDTVECKVNDEFVTLLVSPFYESKVAFIISKKVLRSAVKRNKVKRRMRNCYDAIIEDVPPDKILIFIGKNGIYDIEYTDLCNRMRNLLKRIKEC